MFVRLLLIMLSLLIAGPAFAGWVNCETGAAETAAIGPGKVVCYNFSSSDLTSAIKDFGACGDVDWSFDEDGASHSLCMYVCTNSDITSCAKLTTCLSGADLDASYEGAPGSLQYLKLEGGSISSETPQARGTCH